eukprot:gene20248-20820_t
MLPITEDTPTTGGQQAGRVQTNDQISTPPSLRPVATPTENYVHAPSFSDPNLQRIADSLGGLGGAIHQFGDVQAQVQKNVLPGKLAACQERDPA